MDYRSKVLLSCSVMVAAVSLILYSAFSHSGRTDGSGGHHNRKTGEYHYHGGGRARPTTPIQRPSTTPKKDPPKIQEAVEHDISMLRRDIKLLREEIALLRKEIKMLQSTVYITNTGKKYHQEDCRFLEYSKNSIPLAEAREKYDPCKVCKPPK